jgi:hypothetical protein
MTQFWLTVSQLLISLRVISYEKVPDSPGERIRSSKPRRTIFGSVGPPREIYCRNYQREVLREKESEVR